MMPRKTWLFKMLPLLLLLNSIGCNAADSTKLAGQTIEQAYPGLASVSLGQAVLAKLPQGVLLRSGDVSVKTKDIEAEIAKAPPETREQLKNNGFFLLEQLATRQLLAKVAREKALVEGRDIAGQDDKQIIQKYFEGMTAVVAVSDSEVVDFYQQNQDACGGATLEQMKDQLKQYVLQQKQQELVTRHVRGLGTLTPIEVSSAWVKVQSVLAKNNPVDKARTSGIPTMVDFGSTGCRPCDMMAPILEELKTEYAGKANILFVQVNLEQLLAARFGIQSIPVQVFFDRTGQEISRHVGFFPKDEILKQLRAMGVE
ncbi:MAG: thioredoxin family protein [Candidatus Edwardsbacteria bacterium]|nr:thioredoxin family protein [Candidatus Edwardsbacteria bacterium]